SYYVLVGPYRDDDAAEAAHKNLVSRGFKPRSFKRGSRDFTLHSELILNGTHMPVGDCPISVESYTSEATVKFVQDNYVVATVSGKWLKRGVRYERDAYVYWKNGDGSRTLLEIQFAGMSEVLVLGKPSGPLGPWGRYESRKRTSLESVEDFAELMQRQVLKRQSVFSKFH